MVNTFAEAMARVAQAQSLLPSQARMPAGHVRVGGKSLPARDVLAFRRFMESMTNGSISKLERSMMLAEAQGTGDFANLMGDNLYRALLAQYATTPVSWPSIAFRRTVKDFRVFKTIAVDGGTAQLDLVKEFGPFNQRQLTDTSYTVQVSKYANGMSFSFESFVNDDLQGLRLAPTQLGIAAANTPEYNVTNLYAGNATFFSSGNKNLVTSANGASSNNPVLSAGAITDALTVMRKQVNSDGSPILITGAVLVVPTALFETASRIISALEIRWKDQGGTSNEEVITGNGIAGRVALVCAPWLDVINASSHGATGWYLFANPNEGRPALQVAFMQGYEQPMMLQKAPDSMMVGGGMAPMELGSFNNNTIEYKVEHITGVGLVDPKMAVYSNGTGS